MDLAADRANIAWPKWLFVAMIAGTLMGLGQAAAHLRTDDSDSWLFAYYADQMLHGQLLYADAWDNKPPGIFWLNALGLLIGGGSYGGVIALCALGSCVTLWLFFTTARKWFGFVPAAVGVILASLYLSHQMYRGGSNRPETFVVLFDLAAVYFYQCALDDPRRRPWLLAGAMAGISLVFKQTGVAAFVAITTHLLILWIVGRRSSGASLRALMLVVLGYVAVLLLAIILLMFTGDLRWAWDAVVLFVFRYGDARPGLLPDLRLFGVTDHVHVLALPMILAVGGAAFELLRLGEAGRRGLGEWLRSEDTSVLILLLGWFLVAAFLVFTGPNTAYHYVPTALTPLLLLATRTIEVNVHQRRVHTRLPPYALRYVAIAWSAYMLFTPLQHQLYQLNMGVYMHLEQSDPYGDQGVVEYIRDHTEPDDRIFLWQYFPHVYWVCGRPCGSRFHSMLNATQLRRNGQYIVDDILRTFRTDPPKMVCISMSRALQLRSAPPGRGPDFGPLASFLCERYRPVVRHNPDSVLILDDESAEAPP